MTARAKPKMNFKFQKISVIAGIEKSLWGIFGIQLLGLIHQKIIFHIKGTLVWTPFLVTIMALVLNMY